MSRLVVVSNRVPSPKAGAAPGGLAVGVLGALREAGGVWFGWSGRVVEEPTPRPRVASAGGIRYLTIDLSERDHSEYYIGYANRTLWPVLHYRVDLAAFDRRCLETYRAVNARFAEALAPEIGPKDIVWVHDYQLIPLGEELRRRGVSAPIGFFLHTPFPVAEVLTVIPNHGELVRSLFAYDLVGFQTVKDMRAFADYVAHEAQGSVGPAEARAFGRKTRIGAFPIGIDVDELTKLALAPETRVQVERLKASLVGRDLIIGVDRLDYSKGLEKRLRAFEALLEGRPEYRRRVSLLQIAPPSREKVPEYMEIRRRLEGLSGHINGRFAAYDWVPVRYLNQSFPRRTLAGFFRLSRVGLVTPLRDGMNLIAKEFVASQDPDDPGVLVLSRFAGAAQQMADAIIVNPFDIEGMAEGLDAALSMALIERKRRNARLQRGLRREDVAAWRRNFVSALTRARRAA